MAAGDILWTAPTTPQDISNSNDCAVVDGAGGIGSEIDNSTDRLMYGDVEVVLNSAAVAVGLDARLDVYLIPTLFDGTSYPVPGSADDKFTGSYFVGSISSVETVGTVAATDFTSGILRRIELPPSKFKIGIVNELGVSLAAKTVTVQFRRYSAKVAQS